MVCSLLLWVTIGIGVGWVCLVVNFGLVAIADVLCGEWAFGWFMVLIVLVSFVCSYMCFHYIVWT